MTLRTRIVLLFTGLAAAPLVLTAAYQFRAYDQQWQQLVSSHLAQVHHSVSRDLTAQYLSLARELESTAAVLLSGESNRSSEAGRRLVNGIYDAIELRRPDGQVRRWEGPVSLPMPDSIGCGVEPRGQVRIHAWSGQDALSGSLTGWVDASRIIRGLHSSAVGQNGRIIVADRQTGRILFVGCGRAADGLGLPDTLPDADLATGQDGPTGQFRFREADVARTAIFTKLTQPPWLVVSSLSHADFPRPAGYARLGPLLLTLVVAVLVTLLFSLIVREFTRRLEELTAAAERIGEGDLIPWLPLPRSDEVGRLSDAIGRMIDRIHDSMQQLERSRQLAFVGEMTGRLAHEIRNPLSSIQLNLQILERAAKRGQAPPDLEETLDLCLREITRLDNAVNGVLRMGKPQQPHMAPCDVHALITDTATLMRPRLEQRGIAVVLELDAADAIVVGDDEQLRGALLNLLANAADALPNGGTIRIRTESSSDTIRVRVADDGIGVAPETRRRIFRPFFTTKAEGTGIGLPIALATVERHGGRLYLEKRSELEAGAEFVMELPLGDASMVPERQGESRTSAGRSW